jgi:hypothetical protein
MTTASKDCVNEKEIDDENISTFHIMVEDDDSNQAAERMHLGNMHVASEERRPPITMVLKSGEARTFRNRKDLAWYAREYTGRGTMEEPYVHKPGKHARDQASGEDKIVDRLRGKRLAVAWCLDRLAEGEQASIVRPGSIENLGVMTQAEYDELSMHLEEKCEGAPNGCQRQDSDDALESHEQGATQS